MIFSDSTVRSTTFSPDKVSKSNSPQVQQTIWQKILSLHRIMWICVLLACLGASWFSYQLFLVPQLASFAPDWENAKWVQAVDGNAPVAYFRYVADLNVPPDGAFITVEAGQIFQLYVNGSLIGSSATDIGQGPKTHMYDITSALGPSANVIAIRVANLNEQIPTLRANFGIIIGKSIYYYGTGPGWQATAQSTIVHPRYEKNLNNWTTSAFNASSWPPIQEVASPPVSSSLSVNPLIYEHPLPSQWMSAGVSHSAYFVRQISLSVGITHFWLRLAASGTASIFINGDLLVSWNSQAPVPKQNVASYLSNDDVGIKYRSGLALGVYDFSPYLHAGTNTIAVYITTPGSIASQVGLGNLMASFSADMLISDFWGHTTWVQSNSGWHASTEYTNDWTQGRGAALTWPSPILVGRPGSVKTYYLPESNTILSSTGSQRETGFVPPLLLLVVILSSVGAIVSLWLLISFFFKRLYYCSFSKALELLSLAFIPAIAYEALLLVLSREPQIPQPFPYTWFWGIALIVLVLASYALLWHNAHRAQRQNSLAIFNTSSKKTLAVFAPLAPFHKGLLKFYRTHSHEAHWQANETQPTMKARLLPWLRQHWPLIPLILIATPLISYNLAYEPYWQDELTSYAAAQGIMAHGIPVLPSGFLYPKGELYSYMLALTMSMGGAPRMLSVMEYIVSLPLLYVIGCYFFERHVALLATAMLALSPVSLVWGREVRMYEQAQVLTLLVVFVFYKAVKEPQCSYLPYLAVGCLLADYLSHEETFIILPALVICVLLASRDARHRLPTVMYQKHWWFATVIGISAISIQLLIVKVSHPATLGTDSSQIPLIQLNTNNIPFYFDMLFNPKSSEPLITINSVLATLGCLSARRITDQRVKYCALFLVISFLTLVFVFTFQADRYFYPLLPIFYLIGAFVLLIGLRTLWVFASSRLILSAPTRAAKPALGGYLSGSTRIMAAFTASLICACVLIMPILPIANYNILISQVIGFSYYRHFPDYDTAGQYVQEHWHKGDIVISVSPDFSVDYYVKQSDYYFSIDRALYLFERDGHIIDTSLGEIALLNQNDFQAVLAAHARIWIISDNGQYQEQVAKRFTFPSDFQLVFEGFGSAVYLRGG